MTPKKKGPAAEIDRIVKAAAYRNGDMAEGADVALRTVRSWQYGEVNPSPEGVRALASAFDRKAAELRELAGELRALATRLEA